MKQFLRVLEAVKDGAETSKECADDTGLSIPICSAQLKYLENCGMVRRSPRPFYSGQPGSGTKKFVRWEAV